MALGWENEKVHMAYAYALKEDYNKSIRLWQSCAPCVSNRPDFEYFGSAFYYYFAGQRQAMNDELAKLDTLLNNNSTWQYPEYWYIARLLEAWISLEEGFYTEGLESLEKSMEFLLPSYTRYGPHYFDFYRYYYLGLVMVKQSQPDSARFYLKKMNDLLPFEREVTDRFAKFYHERLFLEILLVEDKTGVALQRVDSLHIPGIVQKIYPLLFFYNLPFKDDIIPRIYLANDDIGKAIDAYENIVTISLTGNHDRRFIPPWFHFRLAKLYETYGQKEKAIRRYQHLLEVWEKADPNIPELIEAQNRLSILHRNKKL
jgi:tetratricopeptide (TPR) repeat protein